MGLLGGKWDLTFELAPPAARQDRLDSLMIGTFDTEDDARAERQR
jgi:hypothetical protein